MTSKTPPDPVRFDDLPLSEAAREGLKALGYELATPVQAAALGPATSGKDLLVQSKTGTGKTTAFGLPVIERIRVEDGLVDPQAIILCPTRELAIQVAEELAELGDPKGVRVLPIYGGTPMGPQLAALKDGCDVIVGTPGRVLDHVRRRTLRLVHIHMGVLDEADEMLSMGFWDEVTSIFDQLPTNRQTFLFSATLPDEIRRAASRYLRDPVRLDISRDELTVEGIKNVAYYRDDSLPKPRNLLYLLEVEKPDNAIIFCNMRQDASVVAAFLRRQGLNALALTGDLGQKDRERIMSRMKRGDLKYLVATDIAARGIDISDLSHVIQYALPEFTEVYVHRIGRTGRIGKSGTAVSLISGRDEYTMTELTREFGIDFEVRELPPREELVRLSAERIGEELIKIARDVEITSFLPVAERLKHIDGGTEVVAFLLKRYFNELEEQREREAREEDARLSREAEARKQRLRERRQAESGDAPEAVEVEDDDRPKKRKKDKDKDKDRDKKKDKDGKRGKRERRDEDREETPIDRVRLFLNRGSTHEYDDAKIGELVREIVGGDEALDVRVQLRRTHAFVIVPESVAEACVTASEKGLLREDKPLTIERARTR
jgi:ATP-dependent RNA helicase DeaD